MSSSSSTGGFPVGKRDFQALTSLDKDFVESGLENLFKNF